ncbi:MAG: hypothetical protein JXA04_11925 [Gammaproteobacteria bacterium]|nr:hypothetical protein [Gammaproteobacteria bacterium]
MIENMSTFKNSPCALPITHPDYQPPTPGDVDKLIKLAGWSQVQAAKLVGVSFNPKKGSTTIRKWRTNKNDPEHREIPYSAWRLFLLFAGIVSIDEDLRSMNNEYVINMNDQIANREWRFVLVSASEKSAEILSNVRYQFRIFNVLSNSKGLEYGSMRIGETFQFKASVEEIYELKKMDSQGFEIKALF